jgi:hypothetical protein
LRLLILICDGKDDLAVGIPLKDLYIYSESGGTRPSSMPAR